MKVLVRLLLVLVTICVLLDVICASKKVDKNVVGSKRILAVFPMAGKSHTIFFSPLLKALAKRGHNVTVYSPFPTINAKENLPNYHDHIIQMEQKKSENQRSHGPNFFQMKNLSYTQLIKLLFKMSDRMCRAALSQQILQDLIRSDEEYDLFITSMFFNDCVLPFAHKFNVPIVQMFSSSGMNFIFDTYGNPLEIATVPDSALIMGRPMSLYDRILNTFLTIFTKFNLWWEYFPSQNGLVKEYFGDGYPPLEIIQKERGSLLLINTNLATINPRSLAPNIKAVGGIQLSQPKPLPDDLQKYFDEAKSGVVYFSLGSAANPSDLPPETLNTILNTFGKLKQRVLFKWTTDKLPENYPNNILITQWAPQSDLLAHSNLKLFVSHGGGLSSQEAIYHGVPLLALPITADQHVNAHNIALKGMGLVLGFEQLTETSFMYALDQLLNEKKYKENAMHLSQLYHDQPIQPLEEAVFWTEYILRHNGAKHLRSDAINLHWWQRELLDVFAIVFTTFIIAFFIIIKLIKCTYYCIVGHKQSKQIKRD